jgi:hypothetical protein
MVTDRRFIDSPSQAKAWQYRLTLIPKLLLPIALIGGCTMEKQHSCFQTRPEVVHPDPKKVMAHISTGASGRSLTEAVFAGAVDTAAAMIAKDRKLLGTQVTFDPAMQSAPVGQSGDLLVFAVSTCNMDMVDMLLAAGMPVDGVQRGQALTLALLADAPDMAERLLAAGASPDPQKLGGQDAMREITSFAAKGGVMTLLRHGLDVQWVDQFGNDHLDTALSMEQFVIAEMLVQRGANLWRIMGAGSIPAWVLTKPNILELPKEEAAARARLLELAQKSGIDWPPPDPVMVRKMVLANLWPNADQAKKGMTISKEAKADISARFGDAK